MGKKIHFFSKSDSIKEEDKKFIDAILNNSNNSITGIIEKYQNNIKKMVLAFKNPVLDPDDIFQEGFKDLILTLL